MTKKAYIAKYDDKFEPKMFWDAADDELFSIHQLCCVFNCHPNSFYKWKKDGKIKPFTNKIVVRYRKKDILDFFGQ